jgi:hypothetical protein
MTDLSTALSTCLLRDGTGIPTADTPWNSKKITGLGTPTALTDAAQSANGFIAEATLASAATTNLGSAVSHVISVTGTTNITSFGSGATTAAPIYIVTFAGALTLTYNVTSLIIPGAANITTAANDIALLKYLGSGNWQVMLYLLATTAGTFTGTLTGCTTSPTTTFNWRRVGTSVTLDWPASLTATSNTTGCTVTGVPAGLSPVRDQTGIIPVENNTVFQVGSVLLSAAGTTLNIGNYPGPFTASGTKGIAPGTFTYNLT